MIKSFSFSKSSKVIVELGMGDGRLLEKLAKCDGTKTINQLTDQFSAKLGMPRQQVEQEVVQLIQQLLEAELLNP